MRNVSKELCTYVNVHRNLPKYWLVFVLAFNKTSTNSAKNEQIKDKSAHAFCLVKSN